MKVNRKSNIPNTIKVGDIYSFVKRGDKTIVGWLGSQLPKGFAIVRTVVRHSDRPEGKYSLTLAVERIRDGKRAGLSLDYFYNPKHLPSKYPKIIAREAKKRLRFLDSVSESRGTPRPQAYLDKVRWQLEIEQQLMEQTSNEKS